MTLTGMAIATPASAASVVTTWDELTSAFAAGGTVTLGADLSGDTTSLSVGVGAPVVLDLHGHSVSVSTGTGSTSAGVRVPSGASLSIEDLVGGGSLTSSAYYGAGIGGDYQAAAGSTTITGGTVSASSSTGGAGIGGGGGGANGAGGTVTISGGTVTARGGNGGAGIGGGLLGPGATVSITGGAVSASGANGGAGIGGGYQAAGGSLTVDGGAVTVSASNAAPVLGSGSGGTPFGSFSILSGSLEIASGSYLTIPSGSSVANSGTIINGGTISGPGTLANQGALLSTGTISGPVTGHNYSLAFDAAGGTLGGSSSLQVYAGTVADAGVALPSVSRVGYVFDGWQTAGGTPVTATTDLGTALGSSTGSALVATLTAHWTAVPPTTVQVDPVDDLVYPADGTTVTLSASVVGSASGAQAGTVMFRVLRGSTPVGDPAPADERDGKWQASFTIPDGTDVGTLTIVASFHDISEEFPDGSGQGTLTIGQGSQSIDFHPPATAMVGVPVSVTSSASSGLTPTLTVTTSAVCTLAPDGTLTLHTAGNCVIRASQAGDTNWSPAAPVTRTITVAPQNSSVILGSVETTYSPDQHSVMLPAAVRGDSGTVNTGSFTFTVRDSMSQVIGTPVQADVVNGIAVAPFAVPAGTHVGTYAVTAVYTDGTVYSSGSATGTLTIEKADQSIVLIAPESAELGSSPQVAASVDSGLTLTLDTTTTSVCTVDQDGNVTLLRTGTCTVRAAQAGDDDWNEASVTRDIAVGANGTTTIADAADTTFAALGRPVTLTATVAANHGTTTTGSVTFTVSQDGTTIGTPVTVPVDHGTATATYSLPAGTHAGTYTVTAAYADAGSTFGASTDEATLTVARADQAIVFEPPAGAALDAAVTLTATAGSGLEVELSSTTTEVCTVTGTGALTLLHTGTCTITADQPGNGDWMAATSVSRDIAVTAAASTTTAAPASTTYSPAVSGAILSADVTSGLGTVDEGAVTFTVRHDGTTIGTPVSVAVDHGTASATYSLPGGTHAGDYTVTAVYADGDGTLVTSSTGQGTLTVRKADQTVSLTAPGQGVVGRAVTLTTSSGSGLPVTLTSGTAAVCTLDARGRLTLRKPGTCVVAATQGGDEDWNPAPALTRSVAVAAAPVVAPPAPDTSWYSDPIPKEKRKRLAPARPGREGGPVRLTKAAYRTHDGTLAVPLAKVRGRQLAKGQGVQLTGLFRFDSARLSVSGRRQLAVLARSMDDVKAFTCEGYSDYGNAVDHELQLSERRAETVCTVLARKVGHGVKAKPHGYGPSRPMVVGGHSKQRTGNRRVDLLVRR